MEWGKRFRAATPSSLGTRAGIVSPDDGADIAGTPKAVEVVDVTNGTTLAVLPEGNADGEWITYIGVGVGFVPKVRVRRVRTTTTCQVIWIDD